jgi:long-chain acyl-CoA synthetase
MINAMHLEDYIAQHAQRQPERLAVVCGAKRITYAQLDALVNERCAAYNGMHGRLIPLKARHDVHFLADYFAIHRSGNVAVLLDERTIGDAPDFSDANVPPDSADVLYTSGTTGKQKGVVISHRAIMANAENLIQAQGYHNNITFIINGPLNHFGSLSKVYPTIVVGGTICLVDGMKNMDAFFKTVDMAEGPVATFLVPASIHMMLAFASRQLTERADKMEFIETGAAPISKDDILRLKQLLPQSRLYNTYASTETGIVATYNYNNVEECQAGCVGHALPHNVIDVTGDGFIACQGDTLMTGYLDSEAHTVSLIQEKWITTNDLGHFDAQGRLFVDGRGDDIINVGGYKVAPTEVEAAALSLPMVSDCICVAGHHPILGTVLKLVVVPTEGQQLNKRELAAALSQRLAAYMIPAQYEEAEAICRTFNGKLDRKAYR